MLVNITQLLTQCMLNLFLFIINSDFNFVNHHMIIDATFIYICDVV